MRPRTLKFQRQRVTGSVLVAIALAACGGGATEPGPLSNRPPAVVSEMPAQALAADGIVTLDVSAYFRDPDGDVLTYSATTDDSTVVKIYVFEAEVTIVAKNRGRPWVSVTTLTVRATDPGGLYAEQGAGVTLEAGDVGFRDEFDSEDSSTWQIRHAGTEVIGGALRLTSHVAGAPGQANRGLKETLIDWEIRARFALGQDSAAVRIVANTGQPIVRAWALEIGPGVLVDGNESSYRLLGLLGPVDWQVLGAGNSARLGKVFEDFVEVRFFQRDGRLVVTVEGEPLHDALIELDYGVVTVGLWVVPLGDATGRSALFEWVEFTGDVVLQG